LKKAFGLLLLLVFLSSPVYALPHIFLYFDFGMGFGDYEGPLGTADVIAVRDEALSGWSFGLSLTADFIF